jgi:hypothetical protein
VNVPVLCDFCNDVIRPDDPAPSIIVARPSPLIMCGFCAWGIGCAVERLLHFLEEYATPEELAELELIAAEGDR